MLDDDEGSRFSFDSEREVEDEGYSRVNIPASGVC